jgi:Ca2+-binding EF-hand superfamily protein
VQSQTKKNEILDEADGGHHLTSNEEEAYEAAFHKYDADDSGKIDDEELSCLLEETTGIKPNAEEIAELKVLAEYVKGGCAWAFLSY